MLHKRYLSYADRMNFTNQYYNPKMKTCKALDIIQHSNLYHIVIFNKY